MTEIKITLNVLKSRLDTVEEGINKIKDILIKIILNKSQREKHWYFSSELQDNLKRPKINVIEILKSVEREREGQWVF